MKPPRRKAPRQLAPSTLDDALAMIADYVDLTLGIDELRADADASIAAIEAERDRMVAPQEERAKALFGQLRAWWAVAGPTLTEGKRKSVELAGALIGERTTPPRLKTPVADVASVQLLLDRSYYGVLRVTYRLDKPVIIKLVTTEPKDLDDLGDLQLQEDLQLLGFRAEQRDEFFIARAGTADAPVQIEEAA